ncbi:cation:proton antiporter [Lapidilactobacillus achengensis]|uniref:Cation:proton antiporter n=1 Tax=Lapidilactobacillus achengensis TaxID=2486000 RepID=A0ABW1UNC8_9LACO|nr:cation:proton antiporter [Lapidilactobacillus achengensis]
MEFLGQITIILVTTLLVGYLCNRIGIPAVLGELIAGVLVGPAVLSWVKPTNFLHQMAEIGVILLMFAAGCESDLVLLRKYFKPSMLAAILGAVLPIVTIWPLAQLFGMSSQHALFLGVVFAATSVSISVVVMQELNFTKNREASTILGAAVVDDILAVIILSLMMSFLGEEKMSTPAMLGHFALQIGYFVGIFVVIKWVTPIVFSVARRLQIQYASTVVSLIIAFGLAYLAEVVGLSDVVGAFFAGVAVSRTDFREEISRSVDTLGNSLFMPIFFVNIGLSMTFDSFVPQIGFILVLTVVAIVTKLIGCGGAVKLLGFDWNSALIVGSGMVSRGEMALIIAQIGLTNHLMSTAHYSAVIAAIILTTLLAPLFLKMAIGHKAAVA